MSLTFDQLFHESHDKKMYGKKIFVLPSDHEYFLMKTSPHIFAMHFYVIAFELFCPQFACLSKKLAALGWKPALRYYPEKTIATAKIPMVMGQSHVGSASLLLAVRITARSFSTANGGITNALSCGKLPHYERKSGL